MHWRKGILPSSANDGKGSPRHRLRLAFCSKFIIYPNYYFYASRAWLSLTTRNLCPLSYYHRSFNLQPSFVACEPATLPAESSFNNSNDVARRNLLNRRRDPTKRLEVYARAQDRLAGLEPDPEKRLKFT